jgi:transposase-like protein
VPSGSPKRKRRRYSPEEVERGLATLVIAGSSLKASEITQIPDDTLRSWKREHLDRYEELRHELEPKIARTIAAEAEQLAIRTAQLEHKILDDFTDDDIGKLKPADKASTLRNLATARAISIDKVSSPLRERPSHVQPSHGLHDLLGQVAKVLGLPQPVKNEAVDSTAHLTP